MRIWVDADAAPRDVKEIVYRAAKRVRVEAVLVANRRLSTPLHNEFVGSICVSGGPDVADRYIEAEASSGDIVVTADIPLAAALVEKGAAVIDPRGELYTSENVAERLSVRNYMESLRGSGVDTGGASAYGARDKQAFAAAFDRVLTAALKAIGKNPVQ